MHRRGWGIEVLSWRHSCNRRDEGMGAGERCLRGARRLLQQPPQSTLDTLAGARQLTAGGVARSRATLTDMLDTLAVTQQLTAAGVARDQAEVIAKAIRQGVEQGDHVSADQFKAALAEVRAEVAEVRAEIATLDTRLSTQIADVRAELSGLDTRLSTQIAGVRTEVATLRTRLIRWMVGTVIATATITVGILRLLG